MDEIQKNSNEEKKSDFLKFLERDERHMLTNHRDSFYIHAMSLIGEDLKKKISLRKSQSIEMNEIQNTDRN